MQEFRSETAEAIEQLANATIADRDIMHELTTNNNQITNNLMEANRQLAKALATIAALQGEIVEAEVRVELAEEVEETVEVVGVEAKRELYACTTTTTTATLMDMISIRITRELRVTRRDRTIKSQLRLPITWAGHNAIAPSYSDRDHRIMNEITMY